MILARRISSLFVLATLALASVSCAGAKPLTPLTPLTAERPKDEAFRTELRKEMSTINVPIEASADELARTLNQMVGNEIYKGSAKYNGLTADITRNGPMTLSAADNFLFLTMPVTVTFNYGIFKAPPVSLKLKFKLNAKITPDWKINAEIYYLGLSDLFTEELGIGRLSLKPRSIIEGITQPVQKSLSEVISKAINDQYPLKPQIAKAWNAAQKPVLLDKNYNAWLRITPREVMLYPLYAQNNQVKLSLGLTSYAELVVGPEPAARPLVPLPDLRLVNNLDRNFRVALNADLYYRDILGIASPLLLNKEFVSDGKSVVLKNLDIYGNGDRLVIKMETRGDLEGIFYLTCKPGFNPQTNMFSVEDVDFDMSTESLLLKSADWFLHGTIKSVIQEKLNMDLTQRLEQSREMAQKAMNQVKLAEHIFLKGSVKTVKFSDVMVQRDKISIQLYTEGETAIVFQ
jgi:hypothetical protein